MDVKEQIQELISLGKTEEALELLEQLTTDAILLQSRFNGAKRQYSMGMIDFSEWSRTQAQINYAALEMMNRTKKVPATQEAIIQPTTPPEQLAPRAFISYNEKDSLAMRSVNAYLKENGVKIFVDIQDLGVGDNIENFIQRALQENQFIVSLISENSLKDGWVNEGLKLTTVLQRFGTTKWIPLALDKRYEDPSFFNEVLDSFESRIDKIKENMKIALERDRDVRSLSAELTRLVNLKNEFSSTMETLGNVSVADISGPFFEIGMARAVKTITNQTKPANAN